MTVSLNAVSRGGQMKKQISVALNKSPLEKLHITDPEELITSGLCSQESIFRIECIGSSSQLGMF